MNLDEFLVSAEGRRGSLPNTYKPRDGLAVSGYDYLGTGISYFRDQFQALDLELCYGDRENMARPIIRRR